MRGYVARGSYLLIENMDRLSRADIAASAGASFQLVEAGINLVTLTNGETYSAERFQKRTRGHFLGRAGAGSGRTRRKVRKGQLVGDAGARKKQRLAEHGPEGNCTPDRHLAWITWSDMKGVTN